VPDRSGRRNHKNGAPINVQRAAVAISDAAENIQQATAVTDTEMAIVLGEIQQVYVRRAANGKDGRQ
jgi:hypothetical protein